MFKSMPRVAAVALSAVLAVGVIAPAAATASTERAVQTAATVTVEMNKKDRLFVKMIRKYAPDVWMAGSNNRSLVRLGKAMCRSLGKSSIGALHDAATEYMSDGDAFVLLYASALVYCPRYVNKVEKFYGVNDKKQSI